MSKITIVFCSNQIALTIAAGIALQGAPKDKTYAIYWPKRCAIKTTDDTSLKCIKYSRLSCILLWLYLRCHGSIEVLIPHRKLGRFINIFTSFCSSISLVDDGLDTFRENPENVDPESFPDGTLFYSFRYSVELGAWLNKFKIQCVADLSSLAHIERPLLDLTNVRRLIIESPPLGKIFPLLSLYRTGTLVVAHSNPNKQVLKISSGAIVEGSNFALESSLKNFKGEIIVGESMIAVFALSSPLASYSLTVWVESGRVSNLRPLISLLEMRNFCSLKLC